MDTFDEFEIKPLTEGLGFHKKTIPLSEQVKRSGLIDAQNPQVPSFSPEERKNSEPQPRPQGFADLLKSLESPRAAQATPRAEVKISEPLPAPGSGRKSTRDIEIPKPTTPEFPVLNRRPATSPLSQVVENVGLKRGAADSPIRMLERAPVSIPSAILDSVIIVAMALVFLMALMTITKVDLLSLIAQRGFDTTIKAALAVLLSAVFLMYVVVSRSFFGCTLGEWTFDLQMGDDKQHKSALYPLQILWRSLLVLGTGIVVFPLLSALLRRDLLAPLTGLQLYHQRL